MSKENINSGVARRTLFKGVVGSGLLAGAGLYTSSPSVAVTPLSPVTKHFPTTIKRVKKDNLTYEVITTDPRNLHKIYSTNFNYSTFSGKSETLESRAKTSGYQALINCDSWANVDGSAYYNDLNIPKRPVGIQVLNGKLLQNFGVTHSELSNSDQHAFYMTKDYRLRHINKGLNNAQMQKYLNENKALWSAGYTTYLVNYGVVQKFDKKGGVSASTLLGQRADGAIIIVVIYGKTGVFGATAYQCAQIMKEENCYNAMGLDGGGSSQIYWNGKYVHHSSDPKGYRPLGGGFLAISGAIPNFS